MYRVEVVYWLRQHSQEEGLYIICDGHNHPLELTPQNCIIEFLMLLNIIDSRGIAL